MKNKRRFERIDCGLMVTLKDKRGETELMTANISLHGVHVVTDHPPPERQLVQLAFDMGGYGEVEVMGMVAWSRNQEHTGKDDLPGFGVEFFALPGDHKDRWTEFVHALRDAGEPGEHQDSGILMPASEEPPPAPVETAPPPAAAPAPGTPAPEPAAAENELAATTPTPLPPTPDKEPPVRRANPRFISCFMLQIKTRDKLREMYTRDISVGGLFISTPMPNRVNKTVQLVLVHPATKEEFQLAGEVVRVQAEGPPSQRGVALKLAPLPPEREAALLAYIESGVNYLQRATGQMLDRDSQLIRALELVGNCPSSLANLGSTLLKAQDIKQAMEAFQRALRLKPDFPPALRGLHETCLLKGDHVHADEMWAKLEALEPDY